MNNIKFQMTYYDEHNEIEFVVNHTEKSSTSFFFTLEELLMLRFEIDKGLEKIRNNNA